MTKGSGTRSGMLWEVERILKECDNLPNILLMENVPQIHSQENKDDFILWQKELEKLGYRNYWEDLNAKDYLVPQNRNRTFMISILGDYFYEFPQKQKLVLRLKDLLESEVDEKYFLSDKMISYISAPNQKWTGNNNGAFINKDVASTLNTGEGSRRCDASNYVSYDLPDNFDLQDTNRIMVVGNSKSDGERSLILIKEHQEDLLQKKLCNKLIEEGKVQDGDIIKHSYTSQILEGNKKCVEKSDGVMITLTTRGDCVGVCVKEEPKVIIKGNYSPSNHNASRIIEPNGIAPTVMENHGTITAIVESGGVMIPEATQKGYAIANDGDGVYINRPEQKRGVVQKGMIQTLKTSCNDVGVVVNDNKNDTPQLIGGIGEKNSNGGTQYYQQNRIYSGECIAMCHPANLPSGSYMYGFEEKEKLRIRKLTSRECFRLMGVKDEDYDKIKNNQSESSLYHLAGDSLITTIIMELIGTMVERPIKKYNFKEWINIEKSI